eukprot:g13542.t1
MLTWLLFLLGAYLLGSVSFALILGTLNGINIREHGSGNVGATNLGRALGKKWGLTCFFLDLGKGLVPVLAYGFVAGLITSDDAIGAQPMLQWLSVGVAAVIGHVFPVFLKFKGGKGVATSAGALLGFWPVLSVPVLAAGVAWFIVTKTTAYVGLASVIAAAVLPLFVVGFALAMGYEVGEIAVCGSVTALLAAMVIVRHRSNIARLRAGTEDKGFDAVFERDDASGAAKLVLDAEHVLLVADEAVQGVGDGVGFLGVAQGLGEFVEGALALALVLGVVDRVAGGVADDVVGAARAMDGDAGEAESSLLLDDAVGGGVVGEHEHDRARGHDVFDGDFIKPEEVADDAGLAGVDDARGLAELGGDGDFVSGDLRDVAPAHPAGDPLQDNQQRPERDDHRLDGVGGEGCEGLGLGGTKGLGDDLAENQDEQGHDGAADRDRPAAPDDQDLGADARSADRVSDGVEREDRGERAIEAGLHRLEQRTAPAVFAVHQRHVRRGHRQQAGLKHRTEERDPDRQAEAMDGQVEQQLCEMLGIFEVTQVETIQSLWSGCGQVARVTLPNASTVVVKHVKMPEQIHHPRGWETDRSAQRKVRSYEVEACWYDRWSGRCAGTASNCRVPRCLGQSSWGDERLLILEDIDASGFDRRLTDVTLDELTACIHWLASFHALFLGQHADGLWSKGTYWHLDTRPDEYDALEDGPLKQAAHTIDAALDASPYQTIVHGDAKLANFCFSADNRVAAVDFQYVGGGCGMKDLAYLVGGCLDSDECFALETEVLAIYFDALKRALDKHSNPADTRALEADWLRTTGT